MLSAPEAVTDDALAFVLVDLEDFGFVDFASIVEAPDKIAWLQFINAAIARRCGNRCMP
jgi:uncharacterized protein with GYD domain